MWRKLICLWLSIGFSASALAGGVTGTIHTLHINLETNRAHVQLDGLPSFNGSGCSSYWTANDISDQNFMKYIWPILMSAKATNTPVIIAVNGCVGVYPKITEVDWEPRLMN